ncbi:MAG: reverse transcriptase domain-containing protein [Methyloligellaceae bacterium]
MPKRHHDLFGQIANFRALRRAARKAVKGKRKKPGAAAFFANLEKELVRLERELNARTYRPGNYVTILIHDPKKRMVSAAPFRDRVLHHALCSVVEPIFEQSFISNSFANRKGKGTHRAIDAYERYRNRYKYVLRCDIFRYFPAIDHEILKSLFRRRIACKDTLWLLDLIVERSNRQEPVNLYFPGDDLFSPQKRHRGLPIGNLTSQFFANLYLDRFDHFATEGLQAPYVRYVDDFALFGDAPDQLENWKQRITVHLQGRRLKLHSKKTYIQSTDVPATFLGFELYPGNMRRLPEDNVRRFRNRLRGMRDRLRAGTVAQEEVERRVQAWVAHAENADTWRLREAVFGLDNRVIE